MSEKKITILTIVYIVVILALGAGGFWYLQTNQIAEREAALAKVKADVDKMEDKRRKLPAKLDEQKALPARRTEIAKKIPTLPKDRWDPLIDHLHAMAQDASVSIGNIRRGQKSGKAAAPKAGAAKAEETYFDITVRGDCNNVFKFIYLLEAARPLILVDNFSIKGKGGGGSPGAAEEIAPKELKILIKAFGFKEPVREEPKAPAGKTS
jgi:hypothetical protein